MVQGKTPRDGQRHEQGGHVREGAAARDLRHLHLISLRTVKARVGYELRRIERETKP
jgi:hypothetical protein